jgi:hypothetical protein
MFKHFGISLHSVDIPFYYFFLYSYSVISQRSTIVLILVVLLLLYVFLFVWYRPFVTAALLTLLFPALFYIAMNAGEADAQGLRVGTDAKTIVFTFKKNRLVDYPKAFVNANGKGQLKLLTQASERFYVIYQPAGEEVQGGKTKIPYGSNFVVPNDDILLADIKLPSTTVGQR